MHTFTAGGMLFTVEFTDRRIAALKANGIDLQKLARRPRQMANLFGDMSRFGTFAWLLLRDQMPTDWTPQRFALELIRAGEAPPVVISRALIACADGLVRGSSKQGGPTNGSR